MEIDTIQAKVEIFWNGLNCQNWWLDISQQTIKKLHDFLCEEMQGVALNVILYELSKKMAKKQNTG